MVEAHDAARRRSVELIKAQAVRDQAQRAQRQNNGAAAKPVTKEFLKHVSTDWAKVIGEMIAETELRCRKQIQVLEARIAEFEGKPLLEDAGVWDARSMYQRGNVVTYDGSAWVCREANANAVPGTSDTWRLMIKRGRDGKDTRGSR